MFTRSSLLTLLFAAVGVHVDNNQNPSPNRRFASTTVVVQDMVKTSSVNGGIAIPLFVTPYVHGISATRIHDATVI
jgi:hypothetical protein